jgi:hypothetical protein
MYEYRCDERLKHHQENLSSNSPVEPLPKVFWSMMMLLYQIKGREPLKLFIINRQPPRDVKGLKDFYQQLDEFFLQQMPRNFWKIADELFRISTMTNSFKYPPGVGTAPTV